MKIKTIVSQLRRDFTAIYKCEHCGHEEWAGGYDDAHFHNDVIPAMPCDECGKMSPRPSCHHGPRCDGRGVNCGPAGAVRGGQ